MLNIDSPCLAVAGVAKIEIYTNIQLQYTNSYTATIVGYPQIVVDKCNTPKLQIKETAAKNRGTHSLYVFQFVLLGENADNDTTLNGLLARDLYFVVSLINDEKYLFQTPITLTSQNLTKNTQTRSVLVTCENKVECNKIPIKIV
jgi:hypothetical protein